MKKTLKFITAGSVDDGKSTLIGRLLYDSDSIHTDQLGVLQKQSKNKDGGLDLSLITDGLRAEREQGITIDVAYKYFATSKRKFIIADAPGHEQYTRNMVTGTSNSDLVILLVDARKGITKQTKRHAGIASLLGIKKVVLAINKIDLSETPEDAYQSIKADFESKRGQLNFEEVVYIPMSALNGDNVATKSTETPWYEGPALLPYLEQVEIGTKENAPARFQTQWVVRPRDEKHHDYRGYAGPVLSGTFKIGDAVTVLPSGIQSVIEKIEHKQEEVAEVKAGQNVILHFKGNIDIGRGDTVAKTGELPQESKNPVSWLAWLSEEPLQKGKTYLLQHRFKTVKVKVEAIDKKWNINDWTFDEAEQLQLNDIAQVRLKTSQSLFFDAFEINPKNGNAILIDETSFQTVGACLLS